MEGVREELSACVTLWWCVWHTALYLDTPLSPKKFLRFHRFQGITEAGLVPERNNEFIFFPIYQILIPSLFYQALLNICH